MDNNNNFQLATPEGATEARESLDRCFIGDSNRYLQARCGDVELGTKLGETNNVGPGVRYSDAADMNELLGNHWALPLSWNLGMHNGEEIVDGNCLAYHRLPQVYGELWNFELGHYTQFHD